jgi:hypothetical protein
MSFSAPPPREMIVDNRLVCLVRERTCGEYVEENVLRDKCLYKKARSFSLKLVWRRSALRTLCKASSLATNHKHFVLLGLGGVRRPPQHPITQRRAMDSGSRLDVPSVLWAAGTALSSYLCRANLGFISESLISTLGISEAQYGILSGVWC